MLINYELLELVQFATYYSGSVNWSRYQSHYFVKHFVACQSINHMGTSFVMGGRVDFALFFYTYTFTSLLSVQKLLYLVTVGFAYFS